MLSKEASLCEIESAAVDLARGGSSLFFAYLDKELINISKCFIAAMYEILLYTKNLLRKLSH
ncbi:MAG: hypothetical protein ACUVRK_01715 [Spirochaetota bacterium]